MVPSLSKTLHKHFYLKIKRAEERWHPQLSQRVQLNITVISAQSDANANKDDCNERDDPTSGKDLKFKQQLINCIRYDHLSTIS